MTVQENLNVTASTVGVKVSYNEDAPKKPILDTEKVLGYKVQCKTVKAGFQFVDFMYQSRLLKNFKKNVKEAGKDADPDDKAMVESLEKKLSDLREKMNFSNYQKFETSTIETDLTALGE